MPPHFFEDIVTTNNFLLSSLKEFFEIVSDNPSKKLTKVVKKLQKQVEIKFGVSFSVEDMEDEEDDVKPTLVSKEELLGLHLTEEELRDILNKT